MSNVVDISVLLQTKVRVKVFVKVRKNHVYFVQIIKWLFSQWMIVTVLVFVRSGHIIPVCSNK